ncbi:DoxX family membrane protein [Micromonospora robiginosa]|uniref:DoxX family membrane protein n=1 Tax=Micromonospora robiginosa TaxID=2749844 RepID=A0A7L6B2N9_9ACTN|nr:DoxX family membrane protein [Micromonospora ferruginea]QLQ36146.1 DoxX family membrane protein [Micromonospora ferruginea]
METMTATIERTPAATTAPAAETPRQKATRFVWAGLRIALGWTFLWAFLDKMFGLGHETPAKNAWINGGSPTKGFLSFGAAGPFQGFYHDIAGAAWADWLFMLGLLGIGVALLLGIGTRIAAAAGGLLLVMMWTAVLPPENNPFMDDHLIYAGLLAGLALVGAGNTLGLGRAWAKLPLVQRLPWLR